MAGTVGSAGFVLFRTLRFFVGQAADFLRGESLRYPNLHPLPAGDCGGRGQRGADLWAAQRVAQTPPLRLRLVAERTADPKAGSALPKLPGGFLSDKRQTFWGAKVCATPSSSEETSYE